MSGYFITGTDTGVGKTWSTLALMHGLNARGLRVAGMKPVATGGIETGDGLFNEDALQLQQASSVPLPYNLINPFFYPQPAAPHIAAHIAGRPIDFARIAEQVLELESRVDILLVEGIGGWEVPLGEECRLSDLAVELSFPVLLVVGMRLGCLNHAILSYEAIVRAGLECAGWIANRLDSGFEFFEENVEILQRELPCRYLGHLPHSSRHGNVSGNKPESFPGNTLDIDEFLRRFNG